jgi:hypothetical protein
MSETIAPASTLTTFATWRVNHPTWPSLKTWLETEEPSIEILEFEGSPYVILKAGKDDAPIGTGVNKPVSEAAQLCRSVVWDTRTQTPCSIAPFAARRDQKIPTDTQLRLEDFVEGVMINVFRSACNRSETHVTTRSRLDADGTFYSDRTFSELFEEALDSKKISLSTIERVMGEPYISCTTTMTNVSCVFMSCVLAHPEHRVVRSVEKANFWAIYRGVVYNDGKVEFFTDDLPASWRPKMYTSPAVGSTWADLKTQFDEIKTSKPWYWQGLVVHSGSGAQRWRFRNADHDRVRRDLRGTESNPFGRFLRLRANKRIQEYLRIYPEDNNDFQGYERDYRSATRTLYAWYCQCHKEHSIVFKALPKSVQPLVFGLHKAYLETLRPASKSLHLAEVIEWVTEHLKTQYGVPNMIRFQKEEVQPQEAQQADQQAQPQGEVDI